MCKPFIHESCASKIFDCFNVCKIICFPYDVIARIFHFPREMDYFIQNFLDLIYYHDKDNVLPGNFCFSTLTYYMNTELFVIDKYHPGNFHHYSVIFGAQNTLYAYGRFTEIQYIVYHTIYYIPTINTADFTPLFCYQIHLDRFHY